MSRPPVVCTLSQVGCGLQATGLVLWRRLGALLMLPTMAQLPTPALAFGPGSKSVTMSQVGFAVGKRRWKDVGRRVRTALMVAIVVGALCTGLVYALKPKIFELFGASESLVAAATPYFHYRLASVPLLFICRVCSGVCVAFAVESDQCPPVCPTLSDGPRVQLVLTSGCPCYVMSDMANKLHGNRGFRSLAATSGSGRSRASTCSPGPSTSSGTTSRCTCWLPGSQAPAWPRSSRSVWARSSSRSAWWVDPPLTLTLTLTPTLTPTLTLPPPHTHTEPWSPISAAALRGAHAILRPLWQGRRLCLLGHMF